MSRPSLYFLLSFVGACMLSVNVVASEPTTYFFEPFDGTKVPDRWVYSKADPRAGMFTVSNGLFHADPWVNRGLQTFQDARFYQISAPLDQEARSGNQTFVVQFSVKHEQNIDCGGGYLKILPPDIDPEKLDGETPFNIMFGPDICGDKRLHIILRGEDGGVPNSRNQLSPFVDQLTHLYTLVLRPDMTYSVWMDLEEQLTGPIDKHWKGLVLPEHIPDPEAKKPEDWVDEKDMDDPEDVKPEDWKDIPSLIPDPEASQPKDWDEKEDGEWTAPMVPNPEMDDKTKEGGGSGEWKPRRIPNPEYKGSWVAPKIRNPDYQEGGSLDYTHGHVALDLWQVKSGTIFDNILITDDEDFARSEGKRLWESLKQDELDAFEEYRREDERKLVQDPVDALMEDDEEIEEVVEEKFQKDETKEHDEL